MNNKRIEDQIDDILDEKITDCLEDYVRSVVEDKIERIEVSDYVDVEGIVESVLTDAGIL
jgi:hypothetical protein